MSEPERRAGHHDGIERSKGGPDDTAAKPPAKDPMKSFRGVLAGTLILEAIVVALALPVIAQLGSGITSAQGWAVVGIAIALLACCAVLRKPWTIWLVFALQGALLAFVAALPAVAIIGLLFAGTLAWLLRLRRDVARRMAEGDLPSQQPGA